MKYYNRSLPLVFDISIWDNYQWNAFVGGSLKTRSILQTGESKNYEFPTFAKEVFYRLHNSSPRRLPKVRPEAQWAVNLHSQLDEITEWQDLQGRCEHDRFAAGVAATSLLNKLIKLMPDSPKELEQVQQMRDQLLGLRDMKQALIDQNQQEAAERVEAMIQQTIIKGKLAVAIAQAYAESLTDMRTSLRDCCKDAIAEQQDAEESLVAFGFSYSGHGGSLDGGRHNVSLQEKLELGRRLTRSPKLKLIAEQAGRLKRLREAFGGVKRKSNDPETSEFVVSRTYGSRIDRVPMNELLYLCDDDLFLLFAQKFAEGRLPQNVWESRKEMGEGPVIVCLDSSGSMTTQREVWAKAVALNVAMIANKNKRDFCLIHFDHSVRRTDVFPFEAMNTEFRNRLLSSIGYQATGGTNFELPLRASVEQIRNSKIFNKADIILVTDGEDSISPDFLDEFNKAKEELKFTCYGISVETEISSALRQVCDQTVSVTDMANDVGAVEMLSSL
ncbi:MAG: VWA domain-containing protein [Nostoc sp.]|uniref:vWA domain-containing protein n=1 Tax=Nostoc sp. TaxID=1180 RepID=UPI002FF97414